MRGPRLKDTVDILSLKPCHLTIVEGKVLTLHQCAPDHSTFFLLFFFFGNDFIFLIFCLEDYTEEQAVAHIRRLVDIVACTTSFGSSSSSSPRTPGSAPVPAPVGSNSKDSGLDEGDQNGDEHNAVQKTKVSSPIPVAGDKGGESAMYPPPRLGQFYDFFSLAHLTPPLHCK